MSVGTAVCVTAPNQLGILAEVSTVTSLIINLINLCEHSDSSLFQNPGPRAEHPLVAPLECSLQSPTISFSSELHVISLGVVLFPSSLFLAVKSEPKIISAAQGDDVLGPVVCLSHALRGDVVPSALPHQHLLLHVFCSRIC